MTETYDHQEPQDPQDNTDQADVYPQSRFNKAQRVGATVLAMTLAVMAGWIARDAAERTIGPLNGIARVDTSGCNESEIVGGAGVMTTSDGKYTVRVIAPVSGYVIVAMRNKAVSEDVAREDPGVFVDGDVTLSDLSITCPELETWKDDPVVGGALGESEGQTSLRQPTTSVAGG